jgi:hypothetical protein
MRQQPGDAAVAVGEGVDPEQAVMHRGNRHQPFRPPKAFGGAFVEPGHPARQFIRRRRDMHAYHHLRFPARA